MTTTLTLGGVALGFLLSRSLVSASRAPSAITLHLYDHCPFCIRVELILSRLNVPYNRVVYGYGQGAGPEKKGYDVTGGPVSLTGKKMLPVLEMDGRKYAESLEIVDMVQSFSGSPSIPCAASPDRLKAWQRKFGDVKSALVRPRIVQLTNLADWSDPRDVAYAKNKYASKGFDYGEALSNSKKLKISATALLKELDESVLAGGKDGTPVSINEYGWGIDDLCLLPDLRSLTVVKGVEWPVRVRRYLEER